MCHSMTGTDTTYVTRCVMKAARHPAIAALASLTPGTPRSELARFLRKNRAEFARKLGDGPVNWNEVAALLYEAGVRGRHQAGCTDRPLTGEAVRRAWYRVRAIPCPQRPPKSPRYVHSPLQPGEIAPGVRLVEPPAPAPAGSAQHMLAELQRQMNERSR